MASPAELVLHCLNTSCVGLHEDTGIGAAIISSDTKYLSEATLMEFLQGLQMTSITNTCLAFVESSDNTNGFVYLRLNHCIRSVDSLV